MTVRSDLVRLISEQAGFDSRMPDPLIAGIGNRCVRTPTGRGTTLRTLTVRVRISPCAPPPPSPTGRGSWLRTSRVRVRIPGRGPTWKVNWARRPQAGFEHRRPARAVVQLRRLPPIEGKPGGRLELSAKQSAVLHGRVGRDHCPLPNPIFGMRARVPSAYPVCAGSSSASASRYLNSPKRKP